MKKQVIAAAVAAAFAVPAMAQVTVGGNFDTSLAVGKNNASTPKNQTLMQTGSLSTSAISMSGSEDLGGGMGAYFRIVTRIGTDEPISTSTSIAATSTATAATTGTTLGDRGMVVGLRGSFGELEVGRSPGSAMNDIQGGLLFGNRTLIGALNVRPDNSISYRTPTVSGFQGRLLYSVGNETAATPEDGAMSELSASYSVGPVALRGAVTNLGGSAVRDDVGGGAASNVSNSTYEQTGFSATLTQSFGQVNVRYIKNKLGQGTTATASTAGSNMGVGIAIPLSSNLTLGGDYYDQKRDDSTYSVKSYTVGVIQNMSKRTNVYGIYQKITNGSAATVGPVGITATAGADNGAFAIGIRHTF